jgi:tetratricopeptide (TPR) repeat protein
MHDIRKPKAAPSHAERSKRPDPSEAPGLPPPSATVVRYVGPLPSTYRRIGSAATATGHVGPLGPGNEAVTPPEEAHALAEMRDAAREAEIAWMIAVGVHPEIARSVPFRPTKDPANPAAAEDVSDLLANLGRTLPLPPAQASIGPDAQGNSSADDGRVAPVAAPTRHAEPVRGGAAAARREESDGDAVTVVIARAARRGSWTRVLRWLLGTAGALLVSLPGASRVWADPPTANGGAETPNERASAWIAQGVALFREQQFEAAREAFAHAYEVDPQSETLAKLGLTELRAGHPVEAAQHLREYTARSDVAAAQVDAMRTKWVPRAESQTARLDIFVGNTAEIRVDGGVAERVAAPTSDGVPDGEPFVSVLIAAGEHDVSVRQGSFVESQHVVARGGELVDVRFPRVPDAPDAPMAARLMPPLFAGEASSSNGKEPTGPSRARWLAVLGVGTASLAAVGTAIGFSWAFERDRADANRLMQGVGESGCLPPSPAAACRQVRADRHAEALNAVVANGLYGTAGGLALLGAATWLFWPSSHEPWLGALHPVVEMSTRSVGASFTGTW